MKLLLTKVKLLIDMLKDACIYGSCFVYAGSLAEEEMVDLRKAIPSVPHVLRKLHTNPENNKLSMFLSG